MDSQQIMIESKLSRVREMREQISRLKAENLALRSELESLRAHFDIALLAAEDLRFGAELEIWDGWNLILGSKREAQDKAGLLRLAKSSGRRIWIVFDGKDENVFEDGLVRVSYTGGSGEHRADKFICDFLRMAKYLGLAGKVSVRTNDKGFLAQARQIVAKKR